MVKHEDYSYIPTIYYSSIINQYYFIFSLSGQEMKTSPIDSTIIDFILTHYNTLSLQGKPAILTSEQFDDLVEKAKEHYYNKRHKLLLNFFSLLKEHDENIRN